MKYNNLLESHPELFNNDDALFEIVTDAKAIKKWIVGKKKNLIEIGLPQEWGEIGVVYEDPFIVIIRDLIKFPSGKLGSYFRLINTADLKGGQASVVLPMVSNKILLLEQFRHPTRKWHWEIPRGFGEPNTPADENARKEVLEEVNGEILDLIDLGPYHSNTGIEGVNVNLFFATLCSVGETNLEEGIKSYKLVLVEEFEEMVRDGEITDGFTIAAYTRAKLKGLI